MNQEVKGVAMSGSWIVDRPAMATGYGVGDPKYGYEPIEWGWVVKRLTASRSYWVATTRADGRPHLSPVWAVWTDGALHFFTDPESLKARCLRRDPRAVIHLESGDEVVILEGVARPARATAEVVYDYERKYGIELGEEPEGMFRLSLTKALAWLESDFPRTATRWRAV